MAGALKECFKQMENVSRALTYALMPLVAYDPTFPHSLLNEVTEEKREEDEAFLT